MGNYKILNELNEIKQFYNKKIEIKLENNEIIDFYFDKKRLSHLLGLHYLNKNKNSAYIVHDNIVKYNLTDKDILNQYKKYKYLNENDFINRLNNVIPFLQNIEKSIIVKRNSNNNSQIKSIYFLLQTKDNKYLEIGLGVEKNTEQYYLEIFLVKNNDNNIDYSMKEKIISVYTYDINNKLVPFSFDKEKQLKLDYVENNLIEDYDYHKALELKIDEIKEDIVKMYKKDTSIIERIKPNLKENVEFVEKLIKSKEKRSFRIKDDDELER